ncbi:RNA repair transcriptional activator RtcR [Desulfobacterales bacterium HSG16]|nr:RNA repair transcriptional activator RtcR [Desulfobacterales bacterium HSG16]
METTKKNVVIGLLGPTLDKSYDATRWNRWRPTVALCQQEDFLVDRLDILYQKKFSTLLNQISSDIKSVAPETRVAPHQVEFENPWDFENVYSALFSFARSYPFDTDKNNYFIHITTGTHVAQICLFLLTEARYFPAKLIQTSPPLRKKDMKTAGSLIIIDLDLSRYDLIASRFMQQTQDDISFLKSGIKTLNHKFNAIIERIEQVAMVSQDPILLMGPTGAGKSHIARKIYELKKVRYKLSGTFMEINCATIHGDGAMSALFGHVKGAFTGAERNRKGLLISADQGILFLDEIGELGLDEQSMLLRAIEEKRFFPVGSDHEVESDFQLICATNRDLGQDVSAGRFREDLFARINLWTFYLPGLKDRSEDIAPNLEYELDRFSGKTGNNVTFNKEAKKSFLRFATSGQAIWSANFRDLNAAVTRMATIAPGGRINTEVVSEELSRLKRSWQPVNKNTDSQNIDRVLGENSTEQMDLFDRVQLAEVIRVCRKSSSLSEAGRKLFAASRQNKKTSNDTDRLRKYLSKFRIDWRLIIKS